MDMDLDMDTNRRPDNWDTDSSDSSDSQSSLDIGCDSHNRCMKVLNKI